MADRTRIRGLGKNAEAYDRWISATDVPLLALAILWLPVLIVPWVTSLPHAVEETFLAIDYFVWAIFVVDYLVRFYLAPNRTYFFTHNLLDLLIVVVPFFRPLRALRLIRLLSLGRVVAIGVAVTRRGKNILTHRGLHFVLLTVLVLVFVCSGIVLALERHAPGAHIHTYGDALWWAIVTLTTVGYGDTFPVTAAGRGVAVVLMLTGIGLIGVLTATVASFFVQQSADEERDELIARLERIEGMLTRLLPNEAMVINGSEPTGITAESHADA